MSDFVFEEFNDEAITDEILKPAAELFSNNYGVWSPEAEIHMGSFARQGRRVRISPTRLRQQCLPYDAKNTYIRVKTCDELVGNVLASHWTYNGRNICWITQLVISAKYRRRRLATKLLMRLREDGTDQVFGVLSTHPATVLAVLRAFGRGIEDVYLNFAKEHAAGIMQASPVGYVNDAKLHGALFDNGVTDGSVSTADTGFWVDHKEPLDTLRAVRERISWPFGELLGGHEFLVLVDGKLGDFKEGSLPVLPETGD